MTNNDIYKKLRIALRLRQPDCVKIFELGGALVTNNYVKSIERGESSADFKILTDDFLEQFLNGLIIYCRK